MRWSRPDDGRTKKLTGLGDVTPKQRPPEQQATARVTREIRDRLVRLAYRFVWNRADAEEIAHDALLQSEAKASELREPGRWWAWVSRMVVHGCHQHGRKRQRWKRHAAAYGEDRLRRHSDQAVAEGDRARVVRELIPQLAPRRREVLVLRHLQGMNYEEIGQVLGISPATARVHAQAAREELRSLLLNSPSAWFKKGDQR